MLVARTLIGPSHGIAQYQQCISGINMGCPMARAFKVAVVVLQIVLQIERLNEANNKVTISLS